MAQSLYRIFVYGTLKRGQPNHHVLTNERNGLAKWLGPARLVNKHPLVVAGRYNMPVLLDKEGEGKVWDSYRERDGWVCVCVHVCGGGGGGGGEVLLILFFMQ